MTPWGPVYTLSPSVQIRVGKRTLGVQGNSGVVSQIAVSPPLLCPGCGEELCGCRGGKRPGHNLALCASSASLDGKRSLLFTVDYALQQVERVVHHSWSCSHLLFPSKVFRQLPQLLLLPGSMEKKWCLNCHHQCFGEASHPPHLPASKKKPGSNRRQEPA